MCAINNVLYIVGNGFDLAHHLPTSYEDFHIWLEANKDYSFIQAFEKLYPDVKDTKGNWRDIESALGSISLEHAIEYDFNAQECPDEIKGENSSHDAYQCGENLKNVIKVLPSCLYQWVNSIDVCQCKKKYDLSEDAFYFTFNYTKTLEDIYGIKPTNIYHIHGSVKTDDSLEMGYGESLFEEEQDFGKYSNWESQDKTLIQNLLSQNKKPVNAIVKEPNFLQFMHSLSNVSSVIAFGHSYSKVDKLYYEEISKQIKGNAHWIFYVHDSGKNKSIERYASQIKGREQTFEIVNKSPIPLLNDMGVSI